MTNTHKASDGHVTNRIVSNSRVPGPINKMITAATTGATRNVTAMRSKRVAVLSGTIVSGGVRCKRLMKNHLMLKSLPGQFIVEARSLRCIDHTMRGAHHMLCRAAPRDFAFIQTKM